MKPLWLLLLFAWLAMPVMAETLSVPTPTWKPDPDARDTLRDLMRQKQQSGELNRFWQQYRERTLQAIKHPAPLGIASQYQPRIEYRALRFVVQQDYRDQAGRIVVAKGSVVEPLKITPMRTGLIFIDGRDSRQIAYAIKRGQQGRFKIVLTAGSPYDLRVKYQNTPWQGGRTIPFYFDQRAMIIRSLRLAYGIDLNRVPVVLSQAGEQLKLEWGMAR